VIAIFPVRWVSFAGKPLTRSHAMTARLPSEVS